LKDRRVEQSNFDTYQMLRINEAPAVEVHIVAACDMQGSSIPTSEEAGLPEFQASPWFA
jgi:isoquinoline 1-oxidoreductase subunit beta